MQGPILATRGGQSPLDAKKTVRAVDSCKQAIPSCSTARHTPKECSKMSTRVLHTTEAVLGCTIIARSPSATKWHIQKGARGKLHHPVYIWLRDSGCITRQRPPVATSSTPHTALFLYSWRSLSSR